MAPINFYLSVLNQNFSMTTAATLETVSLTVPTTDAIISINASISAFKALFQFQGDSIDIDNVDATDLQYYIYPANWSAVNPMNNGTVTTGRVSTSGRATSLGDQDFVAYLALKLLGSGDLVDLFNNEAALISNLDSLGATAATNVYNTLISYGVSGSNGSLVGTAGSKYLTNATAAASNPVRSVMGAINAQDPARLGLAFISGNIIQSVPFLSGDSFSYQLTVGAATGQNSLTSVAAIPARTYLVRFVLNQA